MLSAPTSICIAVSSTRNAGSRVRKQFNTLVTRIESARLRLAAWQESMPSIMSLAERELQPLVQAYATRRRDMVLLLDRMYRDEIKAKRERAKLSKLICSIASELADGRDDPELKAIFRVHGGDDGDPPFEGAEFMDMMANVFGVDAEEFRGMGSAEGIFAGPGSEAGDDDDENTGEQPSAGRGTRRKAAAALARSQRQAAEAAKLRNAVRDIFRKLASALHPDREPDAAERARKTALMQRVTVAYKADDLLALLEMQLEIRQIDQSDLNGLSQERVSQYSKVLEGQLRELEQQIAIFEDAAFMQSGGMLPARPTPQALSRRLHVDIAEMRGKIKAAAAELEAFQDAGLLKAWLKAWRAPAQRYDDAFWF